MTSVVRDARITVATPIFFTLPTWNGVICGLAFADFQKKKQEELIRRAQKYSLEAEAAIGQNERPPDHVSPQ